MQTNMQYGHARVSLRVCEGEIFVLRANPNVKNISVKFLVLSFLPDCLITIAKRNWATHPSKITPSFIIFSLSLVDIKRVMGV